MKCYYFPMTDNMKNLSIINMLFLVVLIACRHA